MGLPCPSPAHFCPPWRSQHWAPSTYSTQSGTPPPLLPPGGDLEDKPPRWVWASRSMLCEKLTFSASVRSLVFALPLAHLTQLFNTQSPRIQAPSHRHHQSTHSEPWCSLWQPFLPNYPLIYFVTMEQSVSDFGDGNRGHTQTLQLLRDPGSCGGHRCVNYLQEDEGCWTRSLCGGLGSSGSHALWEVKTESLIRQPI